MTYRQIESSREIRLWLGQIVVPVLMTTGMIMTNPEARTYVTTKASEIKNKVKTKIKK